MESNATVRVNGKVIPALTRKRGGFIEVKVVNFWIKIEDLAKALGAYKSEKDNIVSLEV